MKFTLKGSSLNSAWSLTFCLFSFCGKKTTKKTWCIYLPKKPLRFIKLVVLLWGVFPQFLSDISRLPFFCQKNNKASLSFGRTSAGIVWCFWGLCDTILHFMSVYSLNKRHAIQSSMRSRSRLSEGVAKGFCTKSEFR